jgi:salicylate hydroxylase
MLSAVPLAVEDANALGTLLSYIPSPSALPAMLSGYQDIRQPACDIACATELARVRMVSLPPGPERDARDATLRADRDRRQEPSEDELRERWEELGIIYTHDATEAAEDWWAKWGRLSVGKS